MFKYKNTYYDYRKSYPETLKNHIIDSLHGIEKKKAVDVGCGTGFGVELLIDSVQHITAIDSDLSMLDKLHEKFESKFLEDRLTTIHGKPSLLNISSSSVNIISSFQAFHYFATNETVLEFDRILRPKGAIILCWKRFTPNKVGQKILSVFYTFKEKLNQPERIKVDCALIRKLFNSYSIENYKYNNHTEYYSQIEFLNSMISSSYAPDKYNEFFKCFSHQMNYIFEENQKDSKISLSFDFEWFLIKR